MTPVCICNDTAAATYRHSKMKHIYLKLYLLTFTQTVWVQRFNNVFVPRKIEVFLNKADGCKTCHI